MDLGIAGRTAILLGSSRGLGRACAESIAREGVHVVINGRTAADAERAAHELSSAHGVKATAVVGDAGDADTQQRLLTAAPAPDIVLLNGAGPSPAKFGDLTPEAWNEALNNGLVGPLSFVQLVLPGMCERRFGRIVAISSAMVKSPNSLMSLSHGTRLGLSGVLKGISKDVARFGVTINQILPERFDTARQEQMAQVAMKMKGITYEEARAEQVASIRARRLGRPEELGDAFAFLCSAQAGYLSGQNIQMDGGSYEGVF